MTVLETLTQTVLLPWGDDVFLNDFYWIRAVPTSSRPPDCPSKRDLDGNGWAFGWGWMGDRSPSKPIQTHFGWDTAGLFLDFGWAFPADGVVPSSALERADSRGRPEGQRGILGRPGRFICRNLVLKPCDHSLGSPRESRVRSRQFSSSWFKYHPKMYASDYIPSNRRR